MKIQEKFKKIEIFSALRYCFFIWLLLKAVSLVHADGKKSSKIKQDISTEINIKIKTKDNMSQNSGPIKWIIISDLDDTLIQSHMMNKINMVKVFLDGRKVFTHLIHLLKDISYYTKINQQESSFYYVSKSYRFTYNGANWLKRYKMPAGKIYQRWRPFQPSDTFKSKAIAKILETLKKSEKECAHQSSLVSKPTCPTQWRYLFFGDNSEEDSLVYQNAIKTFNLENKSWVFIRDVKGDTIVKRIGNQLPSISGNHDYETLYQSESELVQHPWLKTIISPETLQRMRLAWQNQNLIPDYIINTYRERLEESSCPIGKRRLSFCQKKIEQRLKNYFIQYSEKYEMNNTEKQGSLAAK
jgi:phosphatidate phosphatase APP1